MARFTERFNLRLIPETADAYRDAAGYMGVDASDLMRQVLDAGAANMRQAAQMFASARVGDVDSALGVFSTMYESAAAQADAMREEARALHRQAQIEAAKEKQERQGKSA